MPKSQDPLLSVVVPLYNESQGLQDFHSALINVVETVSNNSYELIYCDDGSTDNTADIVHDWHVHNSKVKLIKLSRNFGKESALLAGIADAIGQAVIILDGDGQHPVELITQFVEAWRKGAQVVIGVRTRNQNEGWFKRLSSRYFYRIFNRVSGQKLLPGSTDFRLIDRDVQQAFLSLKESDRITRGLIDWLGFRREFIHFKANPRKTNSPGYNRRKLMHLAANSFVSLSPKPLYWFSYVGTFITLLALPFGVVVFVEQILLGDPLRWKFTGTAMLGILILFLVGLVLLSQGVLSLYISHIHSQSKRRPLYVIDYSGSAGIKAKLDED